MSASPELRVHPIFRFTAPFTGFRSGSMPTGFTASPDYVRDKKICAFCGIAKPDAFKKMLLEARAKIVSFDPFPDHYVFSKYDVQELEEKRIRLQADYLVTTEKDAMRLAAYPDFLKKVCILRMDMEILPRESFENFIVEWLAALAPQGKT
jgi:tetraacyldisaccharide-1-P 4'-kinase